MNCRSPKVDTKDRPCFKCGKKGHMAINCSAKPVNLTETEKSGHMLMVEECFGFTDEGGYEDEDEEFDDEPEGIAMAASFQKAIGTNDPRLHVSRSALPTVQRGAVWKISDSSTLMMEADPPISPPQPPRVPLSLVVKVPGSVDAMPIH